MGITQGVKNSKIKHAFTYVAKVSSHTGFALHQMFKNHRSLLRKLHKFILCDKFHLIRIIESYHFLGMRNGRRLPHIAYVYWGIE